LHDFWQKISQIRPFRKGRALRKIYNKRRIISMKRTRNKVVSVFIAFSMVLTMIQMAMVLTVPVEASQTFNVATEAQLRAALLHGQNRADRLTTPTIINLSNDIYIANGWQPVFVHHNITLNGNGYVISLHVDRTGRTADDKEHAGLFGHMNAGTVIINNLGIVSRGISASTSNSSATIINGRPPVFVYAGGILGELEGGTLTINRSFVRGNIRATANDRIQSPARGYSGGFVGRISRGTVTITDSYSNADVRTNLVTNGVTLPVRTAYSYAGGFVGENNASPLTIRNSYSSSRVDSYSRSDAIQFSRAHVGGLVGNGTATTTNAAWLESRGVLTGPTQVTFSDFYLNITGGYNNLGSEMDFSQLRSTNSFAAVGMVRPPSNDINNGFPVHHQFHWPRNATYITDYTFPNPDSPSQAMSATLTRSFAGTWVDVTFIGSGLTFTGVSTVNDRANSLRIVDSRLHESTTFTNTSAGVRPSGGSAGTRNFTIETNSGYLPNTSGTVRITNNLPTIAVTSSGFNNLVVGQPFTGTIIFTLSNSTYATTINQANFAINNLPQGLIRGTAVRTSANVVTVPISGTPTVHDAGTRSLAFPAIPAANVMNVTNAITPIGTVLATVDPARHEISFNSTNHTFPAATFGYGLQNTHSRTVINTGNQPTGTITVALSGTGASAFQINSLAAGTNSTTISSIAVVGNSDFTIRPRTGLAAGTHTATVTVSGANLTSHTFTVSFTVNRANQTLTANNISMIVCDNNINLSGHVESTAGAVANSGAITYTVTNAGGTGATISGNTLSFTSAGTATITATAAGSSNFNPATVTFQLVVTRGPLTGTATITGTNQIGRVQTVNTENVGGSGAFSYQWTADGIEIPGATESTFTLTGEQAGTIIRCIVTRANNTGSVIAYRTTTVPFSIVVDSAGTIGTDSVTLSSATGRAGNTITLTYTLSSGGSANSMLSFTGATGLESIMVVGSGTLDYIVVASDAVDGIITIGATFTHTDLELRTLDFALGNQTMTFGDDDFTNAAAINSGTGTISYESSNPAVVTVTSAGKVTIVGVGTATITARVSANSTYAAATASYTVTVGRAAQNAPTGLSVVNQTATNSGSITGVTTAMEFRLNTDAIYTSVTETTIAELAPGIYHVRYSATATHEASEDVVVTISAFIPISDSITRETVTGVCPICGEERQWNVTRLATQCPDTGALIVSERRATAKRNNGVLITPCPTSNSWTTIEI
jgi:hypothetical protein